MKTLEIKQRPSKMVSLRIPLDTLEQLKKVAATKELGYQSLLKLYIGEGLRKDLAEMGKQSLLSETENLLRKHLDDDKQVKTILRKLRQVAAAA
jgi:predicted DNA binding CopG/RHH family protein